MAETVIIFPKRTNILLCYEKEENIVKVEDSAILVSINDITRTPSSGLINESINPLRATSVTKEYQLVNKRRAFL